MAGAGRASAGPGSRRRRGGWVRSRPHRRGGAYSKSSAGPVTIRGHSIRHGRPCPPGVDPRPRLSGSPPGNARSQRRYRRPAAPDQELSTRSRSRSATRRWPRRNHPSARFAALAHWSRSGIAQRVLERWMSTRKRPRAVRKPIGVFQAVSHGSPTLRRNGARPLARLLGGLVRGRRRTRRPLQPRSQPRATPEPPWPPVAVGTGARRARVHMGARPAPAITSAHFGSRLSGATGPHHRAWLANALFELSHGEAISTAAVKMSLLAADRQVGARAGAAQGGGGYGRADDGFPADRPAAVRRAETFFGGPGDRHPSPGQVLPSLHLRGTWPGGPSSLRLAPAPRPRAGRSRGHVVLEPLPAPEAYFGVPCGGLRPAHAQLATPPSDVAYIANHGEDRVRDRRPEPAPSATSAIQRRHRRSSTCSSSRTRTKSCLSTAEP